MKETDYTCPLILIDEHGPERVCGAKLVITEDGDLLCPDCEEVFVIEEDKL
jgi:uncharacterized Zn finger protein (UPF0148 family)